MTGTATPAGPPPARSGGTPARAEGPGGVTLREMRWWDIDPVLALERALFPADAWSPGMFWSELAHARGPGATRHYVVATAPGGGIVGYAGLAAAGGAGDVQTIAVAPAHQGAGVGARLLTDLLSAATAFECSELFLEVRVDNAPAQRLYERFGFEPIGIRHGYYQPGNVDALVMRRRTTEPADPAERPDPVASAEFAGSDEHGAESANAVPAGSTQPGGAAHPGGRAPSDIDRESTTDG